MQNFYAGDNNKFSKKCSNRNYYYNNNKKNQNSNQEEATTSCILQLFRRRPHNLPTDHQHAEFLCHKTTYNFYYQELLCSLSILLTPFLKRDKKIPILPPPPFYNIS